MVKSCVYALSLRTKNENVSFAGFWHLFQLFSSVYLSTNKIQSSSARKSRHWSVHRDRTENSWKNGARTRTYVGADDGKSCWRGHLVIYLTLTQKFASVHARTALNFCISCAGGSCIASAKDWGSRPAANPFAGRTWKRCASSSPAYVTSVALLVTRVFASRWCGERWFYHETILSARGWSDCTINSFLPERQTVLPPEFMPVHSHKALYWGKAMHQPLAASSDDTALEQRIIYFTKLLRPLRMCYPRSAENAAVDRPKQGQLREPALVLRRLVSRARVTLLRQFPTKTSLVSYFCISSLPYCS
jgi:hypothetical protein